MHSDIDAVVEEMNFIIIFFKDGSLLHKKQK